MGPHGSVEQGKMVARSGRIEFVRIRPYKKRLSSLAPSNHFPTHSLILHVDVDRRKSLNPDPEPTAQASSRRR